MATSFEVSLGGKSPYPSAVPLTDLSYGTGAGDVVPPPESLSCGNPSGPQPRREAAGDNPIPRALTPSPVQPPGRKHSPWTNPRQRKKNRNKEGNSEDARSTRGSLIQVQAQDLCTDMEVLEQLQAIHIHSPAGATPGPHRGVRPPRSGPRPHADLQDISPPKKVKLEQVGCKTVLEDSDWTAQAHSVSAPIAAGIYEVAALAGRSESFSFCPATASSAAAMSGSHHRAPHLPQVQLVDAVNPLQTEEADDPVVTAGSDSGRARDSPAVFFAAQDIEIVNRRLQMDADVNDEEFVLRTHMNYRDETASDSTGLSGCCSVDAGTGGFQGTDACSPAPSLGSFTQRLNAAAKCGNFDLAEALWAELHNLGYQPDVHALNALLRCMLRAAMSHSEAEAVVREVCSSGGTRPNSFTHQLLSTIMMQSEQLEWGSCVDL